jgi:D-apionolactonase
VTDAWAGLGAAPERVRIGAWTAAVVDGGLDDLERDGIPVLRSVRAVARDHDWRTLPVIEQRVEQLVESDGSALRLVFRARAATGDLDGVLTATERDGALVVATELTARVVFRRARIGLVVLHGPEVAGLPFRVGDDELRFPERISPHQPARGIRELRWSTAGAEHAIAFEGDVFEMEDQRNWTDASFKTYGTPLALPFPVAVAAGDVVRQSVRVTSSGGAAPARPDASAPVVVDLAGGFRLPSIAVGASTAPDADAPGVLPPVPADAVLVELRAMDANWRAALDRARRDAGALPLDVRIVASDPTQLGAVLDAVTEAPIVRLGVFDAVSHVSEPALYAALAEGAAERGIPSEALAGGARSHFTELNRTHERVAPGLPAIAFSITAEMHDRSTRQVVDAVGMQRLVARDARAIAGDRPVHVGPITLRARFNAVATTPDEPDLRPDVRDGYGAARDPESTDPRQGAAALEAWTIASVAALAAEGVASAAYFEAWGPRGIHDGAAPAPAWRALERLRAFAGRELLLAPSAPDRVAVLAIRDDDGAHRVLAASLRPEPVALRIHADGEELEVVVPASGVVDLDAPRPQRS